MGLGLVLGLGFGLELGSIQGPTLALPPTLTLTLPLTLTLTRWGGHDYHSARSELLPGASPSFRRDLSTPPASPQMKLAPSPLGAKKKEFSGTGRYNGAPARTLTLTLTLALVLTLALALALALAQAQPEP